MLQATKLRVIRRNHPVHNHASRSNIKPQWPRNSGPFFMANKVSLPSEKVGEQDDWNHHHTE